MKNVCIFDLDGTLVDTLDSLTISANLTMKELGLDTITKDQCRSFIGNGARFLVEKAVENTKKDFTEEYIDEAVNIYFRVFADNCMYNVVPYDGMNEVLTDLKNQGYRFAILSNKPHERTVETAVTLYGERYFEVVQGQCDSVPRKPDPESIRYVMSQMGVEKESCIYIGDSEVDIMTGKAAEIVTVGVSWGFRDRSLLEDAKATAIVDNPRELLEALNEMNCK